MLSELLTLRSVVTGEAEWWVDKRLKISFISRCLGGSLQCLWCCCFCLCSIFFDFFNPADRLDKRSSQAQADEVDPLVPTLWQLHRYIGGDIDFPVVTASTAAAFHSSDAMRSFFANLRLFMRRRVRKTRPREGERSGLSGKELSPHIILHSKASSKSCSMRPCGCFLPAMVVSLQSSRLNCAKRMISCSAKPCYTHDSPKASMPFFERFFLMWEWVARNDLFIKQKKLPPIPSSNNVIFTWIQ